jgi:ligand-binding sensor domain-containing protein/heme exporter protein D
MTWAFAEREDGLVWVSIDGAGVCRFDPRDGTTVPVVPADTVGRVYDLALDDRQRLWMATGQSGVIVAEPDGRIVARYAAGPNGTGLPTSNTLSVAVVDTGSVLVGTVGHGLLVLDPEDGSYSEIDVGDRADGVGNSVYAITRDSTGRIWLGCDEGLLAEYLPGSATVAPRRIETGRAAAPGEVVWSISETDEGYLWLAGREAGAVLYDPGGRVVRRLLDDPTQPEMVYSVIQTGATVWIATDDGLFRIVGDDVARFTTRDGLRSNEFNSGAAMRATDNTIYLGGADGFIRFDPGSVVPSTYEPRIVVSEIVDATMQPIPWDRVGHPDATSDSLSVELVYPDTSLAVTVASLDFADPVRNRYAYRLDGSSSSWIELGSRRTVILVGLRPGAHTLEVRGTNGDGRWSRRTALLHVRVARPVWYAPWSFAIIVTILLVVVVVLSRRRIRLEVGRRSDAEQRMEEAIAARDAELRRVHALLKREIRDRTPLDSPRDDPWP